MTLSAEQIQIANERQAGVSMDALAWHPLACQHGHGETASAGGTDRLIATSAGLVCPHCGHATADISPGLLEPPQYIALPGAEPDAHSMAALPGLIGDYCGLHVELADAGVAQLQVEAVGIMIRCLHRRWDELSGNRCRIVEYGPETGRYLGCPIPAWYRTGDGDVYGYEGVTGQFRHTDSDCAVLYPGLLYRRRIRTAIRTTGGP